MSTFASGNKVRVLRDRQLVQNLQQGHGGWNDSMAGVRRKGENRFSSKLNPNPFDSQTGKLFLLRRRKPFLVSNNSRCVRRLVVESHSLNSL